MRTNPRRVAYEVTEQRKQAPAVPQRKDSTMEREEILKQYTVDERGTIRSPGKFEAEPLYTPHFWDAVLNGEAEDHEEPDGTLWAILDVTPEDRDQFPELADHGITAVALMETGDGFVYIVDNTVQYWREATNNYQPAVRA